MRRTDYKTTVINNVILALMSNLDLFTLVSSYTF